MEDQDIHPNGVPTAAKPPFRKKKGLYLDAKGVPRKGSRQLLVEMSHFKVEPTQGTAYPCRAKDLKSYRRRPLRTAKPPMDNEAATRLLVDWLSKPVVAGSVEHVAMHNLANGMQLEEWGPDLIIKAFDDLDVLFFRGVLATRTRLDWASQAHLRQIGVDPEGIYGLTSGLGYGRCHISLSATCVFLLSQNPYTQMWATMLHEMVVR
ncbi:MAG: hypothetical protein L6R37_001791 [Teloschistes peruensis]|nr:MAG: hypothetical protein L6R37_001791 [Teloschistes peruensis]